MSDDEVDHELLDLLRAKFGLGNPDPTAPPETRVLEDAEFICDNSVDVALSMRHTKLAAISVLEEMRTRDYSTKTWAEHELHPKAKDEATLNFIFTMDLLNFSFWSESSEEDRFTVRYKDKDWTGYWSLVAALQRALDAGTPITSPGYWVEEEQCTEEILRTVFRSETKEEIPLFAERCECLHEAGLILEEEFDGSVVQLIENAKGSAAGLVNLLTERFPSFRDEVTFEKKEVRFLKRAQIFAADVWAAFEGQSYGTFKDIDKITMFADYRIPQQLHSLGILSYSPPLEAHIRRKDVIEAAHRWEVQIRGCSIWAVELLRREVLKLQPDMNINAILIDFFLYDLAKEREKAGEEAMPHHRTRSIWY